MIFSCRHELILGYFVSQDVYQNALNRDFPPSYLLIWSQHLSSRVVFNPPPPPLTHFSCSSCARPPLLLHATTRSLAYSLYITAMSHERYNREDRDRVRPARHTSQYDMLQPHFIQAESPVPPRHRYRATQYHDPVYDVEEDGYEQDGQFDSFGEWLIG